MTRKEYIELAKNLTEAQALVVAGKIIADALDRQTELNRKNIEMQMKASGMASEMIQKLMGQMDKEMGEGEEWKKGYDEDNL